MPLSEKKKRSIKKEAMEMAKNGETLAEATAIEKDYEDVILELNSRLENAIDEFTGIAVPHLNNIYSSRPSSVLVVVQEQSERIRTLTQHILNCIEPVKDAGFRLACAQTLKNIVDICICAINQQYARTEIRKGIQLS